jgi:hypothetical protein
VSQTSTLTICIQGESGCGKSQLADTVPGPRLVLDAEGGSQYTPSWPKAIWNPDVYAPPGFQGCEPGQEDVPPTTRVLVREWSQWARVHAWLESGSHPFRSFVADSITEIQKRCRDSIRGTEQMQTQHWGELLIQMETVVRGMRDLTLNPANPLKNVVVLALTDEKAGLFRPLIQGALQKTLPGFFDVMGFMYTEPQADGSHGRRLLIQPYGQFVAKDRTDVLTRTYGPVVPIRDIHTGLGGYDIGDMVATLDGRHAQAAPVSAQPITGGTSA